MLKIKKIDNRHYPRFFCDVCGGEIENTSFGGAVIDTKFVNNISDLAVVHKGICLDIAEKKFKRDAAICPGWLELNRVITFLENGKAQEVKP